MLPSLISELQGVLNDSSAHDLFLALCLWNRDCLNHSGGSLHLPINKGRASLLIFLDCSGAFDMLTTQFY